MFMIGVSKYAGIGYIGEVKGNKLVLKDGDLPTDMFKELIMPVHESAPAVGTKGIGFCNSSYLPEMGNTGEIITPEEFFEGREHLRGYVKPGAILFKGDKGNKFVVDLFIPYNYTEQ
jgi:hypothetical protein